MAALPQRISDIPKFKGERRDFAGWWNRFKGYGRMHGFVEVLQPNRQLVLSPGALSVTDANGARLGNIEDRPGHPAPAGGGTAAEKIAERNRLSPVVSPAALALTMAIVHGDLSILVTEAGEGDAEYPDGDIWKMVAKLFEKFRPNTSMSFAQMSAAFQSCTMRAKDDPTILFEKFDSISQDFRGRGVRLPLPDQMLTYYINSLPSEYGPIITHNTTNGQVEEDTLQGIREAVIRHYTVLRKGKEGATARSNHDELEGAYSNVDVFEREEKGNQGSLQEVVAATVQAINAQKEQASKASAKSKNSKSAIMERILMALEGKELGCAAVPNQETQAIGANQIRGVMICYKCGQEDHRANVCPNPRNPVLVREKMLAIGRIQCIHCGG